MTREVLNDKGSIKWQGKVLNDKGTLLNDKGTLLNDKGTLLNDKGRY